MIKGGINMNNINVGFATYEDLHSWIELVEKVRWNFPGLESNELLQSYQDTVIKNINRNSAICAKYDGEVVGILLFSFKHNMLSCMSVHPDYRNRSIATKMIELMLSQLSNDCDIMVTTFRDDDEKGYAPRSLYRKLGFVEDELCIEFNYPLQKFILHRN